MAGKQTAVKGKGQQQSEKVVKGAKEQPLAKRGKQEISTDVIDFSKDMGAGFEDTSAADYAIPFLRVLQSNSPACEVRGAAQVPGAVPGHFLNTASEDVYDGEEGVVVVPVLYKRCFIEWKPNRGGFVREYSVADGEALLLECEKDEKGKDRLPNGNILQDTRNWYIIIVPEEKGVEPIRALLSLTSTQIKKSKKWLSKAEGLRLEGVPGQLPLFSHMYRITTVTEANDDGTWFGVNVDLEGIVQSQELYLFAKQFREGVRSGAIKEQTPYQEGDSISEEM